MAQRVRKKRLCLARTLGKACSKRQAEKAKREEGAGKERGDQRGGQLQGRQQKRGLAREMLHKGPEQELCTGLMEPSDKDVTEWL